jgi:hypothetical protein
VTDVRHRWIFVIPVVAQEGIPEETPGLGPLCKRVLMINEVGARHLGEERVQAIRDIPILSELRY